jgi:glycine/D-amino acid oxidase-like deaminating enzyme
LLTHFNFALVVTANVPVYLNFLVKTLIALGGRLEQQSFDSLQSVMDQYQDADTLINCTGMGSYYLKDVQDHTLYPVRGQTVIVRAPHIKHQLYKDVCRTDRFCTYIIPRGDGTVVLGGTLDRDDTNMEVEPELTKAILENAYKLHPYLTHNKGPDAFDILSVDVSFRPGRDGGIRLEKETRCKSDSLSLF